MSSVLTRRLKRNTLEMLAIHGEVAPVLTRWLKPDFGGWSGHRRNRLTRIERRLYIFRFFWGGASTSTH